MQQGRNKSHHTSLVETFVRNVLHRIGCRHSNRKQVVRPQRWWRTRYAGLRASAEPAQHCTSATCDIRASSGQTGGHHRVSGQRFVSRGARPRKNSHRFEKIAGLAFLIGKSRAPGRLLGCQTFLGNMLSIREPDHNSRTKGANAVACCACTNPSRRPGSF
jgi:hypothetical protein